MANILDRFVIVVVSSHKGCFVARVWADRCLDEIKAMADMLSKGAHGIHGLGTDGIHITAGPAGYDWTYHAEASR